MAEDFYIAMHYFILRGPYYILYIHVSFRVDFSLVT